MARRPKTYEQLDDRMMELYTLDKAHGEGFSQGFLAGLRYGWGQGPFLTGPPRTRWYRLMRYYEKELKRIVRRG